MNLSMKLRSYFFVYTIIYSICFLPSSYSEDAKEKEKLDKSFLEDLEKYITNIPITEFDGDTMLMQFSDRLNRITNYRHIDSTLMNQIVYERRNSDIVNKEVVILTESEDHIKNQKPNKKRIYVVLRKNSLISTAKVFFVSYLYIRDAGSSDKEGIHQFGHRKVMVEWDFWNNREDSEDFKAKGLEESFECSSTIFIPCRSNETIDYAIPDQRPKLNRTIFTGDTPPEKEEHLSTSKSVTAVQGFNSGEYSEYFKDFQELIDKSKHLSPSGRNLTGQKGRGLFGILNGLVNLPFQLFGTAVNTAFQIGMGLVKNFGGMFGGIGTPEAQIDTAVEILVEVDDASEFLNRLSVNEENEIEDEVRLPSAGGLGGMINADEDREALLESLQYSGMSHGRALADIKRIDAANKTTAETKQEDPYVRFGWNTDLEDTANNSVFVGFGACRYRSVVAKDFENITGIDEILHLYQTALRTQCIKKDTKMYKAIIEDGILILDKDNTFQLNKVSPQLAQEKLTQPNRIKMYRALELSMFSKVYLDELKTRTEQTFAPDGSPISRSTFTFGKAVQRGLEIITTIPRKHLIKFERSFVKTLLIAFSKLVEDGQVDIVSPEEKEINFNDKVYLMSHIQFIMHGMGPVHDKAADVYKSLFNYYKANKEILEDKINNF